MMNKVNFSKWVFSVVLLCLVNYAFGQKYFTKTGEVSFFSKTPMENIEAVTNSGSSVIDMSSGNIQWAVLIKSFEFEKALMQEHFNENYMESTKYPKAKFKGTIDNRADIDFSKDGTYEAQLSGTLEIHGVEQQINTKAIFVVTNGAITSKSRIVVKVEDYGIAIPSLVKENIAKEIEIKIEANYEAFEK